MASALTNALRFKPTSAAPTISRDDASPFRTSAISIAPGYITPQGGTRSPLLRAIVSAPQRSGTVRGASTPPIAVFPRAASRVAGFGAFGDDTAAAVGSTAALALTPLIIGGILVFMLYRFSKQH